MNRLNLVNPDTATGQTAELFTALRAKLGGVPNIFRVMGNSPAALGTYVQLSNVLGQGTLDMKTREAIALAIGQHTRCHYCVSAHTLIAKKAGLGDLEILAARKGESADPKLAALLKLATLTVKTHGNLSDDELAQIRSAGVSDGEIAEVTANVALNLYTNYINHIADTKIDFPPVTL